jgi:hypothetical protein
MDRKLPSDEQIAKILIGCWSGIEITHNLPMQYLTWYNDDGTLRSSGSMLVNGQRVDFTTKGNWKVENSKLINHVTDSTVKSIVGQDLINAFAGAEQNTTVFVSSENALVVNEREDPANPDPDFHDRLVVRTYLIMIEFEQTDRDQYAHWLADEVVTVDMPNSLSGARETSGLDNVLKEITSNSKMFLHDYDVSRVTKQSPVLVFEMTDTRSIAANSSGFNAGQKIKVPTCAVFQIADARIIRQTNYLAFGPDSRSPRADLAGR